VDTEPLSKEVFTMAKTHPPDPPLETLVSISIGTTPGDNELSERATYRWLTTT
jgi:hypothetical protein